jgi:DNA-binding NarL/FixJ family response regulator
MSIELSWGARQGTTLKSRLNVLIVEDDARVRASLVELLRAELDGAHLGEAADGPSALALFMRSTWDVVVLDVSLKGESGPAVLEKLRGLAPDLPVVMCSGHASRVVVEATLKRGALGYVVKQDADSELVPAIEHALKGEIYLSQNVGQRTELEAMFAPQPAAARAEPNDQRPAGAAPDSADEMTRIHRDALETIFRAREAVVRARQIYRRSLELKAQLRLESWSQPRPGVMR